MNNPKTIEFFVPGIPRPGGSKRVFINKKTGKPIITDAGGKATKDWRAVVALAAKEAMGGMPPFLGPVSLDVGFYLPRPKNHYRTGKFSDQLRDNAPDYHSQTPDRTKLLRSTEDAMKGIVYRDDAQVALGDTGKFWGDMPGAQIRIETLLET